MNRLPALLAVAALAFIPSLHADDAAIRKACITQVRELYSLNLAYAHRNGGQFAKSFDAIFAAEKKADRSLLVAPLSKDKATPSYELVVPGEKLSSIVNPARTVAIRARYTLPDGGVPVAYADGHVEILNEPAR